MSKFSHIMHNAAGGGRAAFFFTATNWSGEPTNREPGKCASLQWFALNALPDQVIDYCRTAIEDIAAGSSFSLHGW